MPSAELNSLAGLTSIQERMQDLNEAYALNAIFNENPLFEELLEEYEDVHSHYLKDNQTFLCSVKHIII